MRKFKPLVILLAGLFLAMAGVASAQGRTTKPALAEPAVYLVNLTGMTAWDVTPEMLVNIFEDVDRNFGDLMRVANAGPDDPDQIVQAEAWPNHVVVLRIDLTHDLRATNVDPQIYVKKFRLVLEQEIELRNRRVALWIRRADDIAALMLQKVPEVFVLPGATSTITERFAEQYSGGDPNLVPTAPSLEGLTECTTYEDIVAALALPENTPVITGDAQKILDRWAQFRDKAVATAESAVGEQWDNYEKVINDPDAHAYQKINARRDIENSLRRAHTYLVRYNDLKEHPVFAPLVAQVLDRIRVLSETPHPRR